jgi:hypothetical protein
MGWEGVENENENGNVCLANDIFSGRLE